MNIAQVKYPIAVVYRFSIAFVVGFICANYFAYVLTLALQQIMPNAEAIYLAAFVSLFFFIIYVIFTFIIHSLAKITWISALLLLTLYLISQFLG